MAGNLLRAYPPTDLAAVKEELKKFLSTMAKTGKTDALTDAMEADFW